jgi:hypothetical protein
MSQQLMDYVSALHEIERAAARLHVAELDLSDERSSALAVNQAQDAVAIGAKKLARAVDELPMGRKPKGWAEA